MHKISQNLFRIIKDALAIEKLPSDFSLTQDEAKEIFALAKRHAVGQFVDGAIQKINSSNMSKDEKKEIRDSFLSALNDDARKSKCLKELCEAFEAQEIDHMPLKWARIKELYAETWMRTSSDIDILVRKQDVQKATEILLSLGYSKDVEWKNDISFYLNDKVHIELHFQLTEKKMELLEDPFSKAEVREGTSHYYVMRDEYEYLYHILHMARHFAEKGCGIRFFIDLWLLNNICVEPTKRNELLEKVGLKKFEEKSLALSKMWFNDEFHPELEDYSTFVVDSAIYGTKEQYVLMKRDKTGKVSYIRKRIFLPYETLSRLYPSLKGKKYLTPYYEVKRIIDVIRKEDSDKWSEIKANNNASKDDIKKASELMNMLGM